jgi:hypothetical protein
MALAGFLKTQSKGLADKVVMSEVRVFHRPGLTVISRFLGLLTGRLRHQKQDGMVSVLHARKTRMSRSIRQFHETLDIPNALRVGRPSRVRTPVALYIEARTIQSPSKCGESLSGEISEQLGISLSRTDLDVICAEQRFDYHPICHDQVTMDDLTRTPVLVP